MFTLKPLNIYILKVKILKSKLKESLEFLGEGSQIYTISCFTNVTYKNIIK